MSAMQSEVYEAFRAIDSPEDRALKAATALAKRDDDRIATLKTQDDAVGAAFIKRDDQIVALNADVSVLKVDVSALKADVSTLKTDVSSLKTDMTGVRSDISSIRGELTLLK